MRTFIVIFMLASLSLLIAADFRADITALEGESLREAVRVLKISNNSGSTDELIEMLHKPEIIHDVTMARTIINAITYFDLKMESKRIAEIACKTESEEIFAVALINLGKIADNIALKTIIDNSEKYSGKYTAVAVSKMADMILRNLDPEYRYFEEAVAATEFLFMNKHVDRLKDILLKLLRDVEPLQQKQILQSLQQRVDKAEAKQVIEQINRIDIFAKEWDFYRDFADSKQIAHSHSSRPAVSLYPSRGNLISQEYGDPAYQVNSLPIYSWLGHTGFFGGITPEGDYRLIEVAWLTYCVLDDSWDIMINNPALEYWGTFNHDEIDMTFDLRRQVMNTSIGFIGEDISYIDFTSPDIMRIVEEPGERIDPDEITHFRCDGMVEYCFEYNDIPIWGRYGQNYDVSIPANLIEHNELYGWNLEDPDYCTAPLVQCGMAGGTSTHLTQDALVDLPIYEVGYVQDGIEVIVTISATDRSGIQYIAYNYNDEWRYSPAQPQHPNSDTYTYQFAVNVYEPTTLYFYAMDNAGNFPENAEEISLDLQPYQTEYFVFENFDEEWPPTGWSGDFDDDEWNRNGTFSYNGSECANYSSFAYYTSGDLITPEFDLSQTNNNKLKFWYMSKLYEGYMGDYWNHLYVHKSVDGNNWDEIVHLECVEEWAEFVFELEQDVRYIKFIGESGFAEGHDYDIHLDNLKIYGEPITAANDNEISYARLLNNYPNPFKPSAAGRSSTTTISFSLEQESKVEISIYNIKGQKIKTLLNERVSAGSRSVIWKGDDDNNNPVSSGVYFCRLKTGNTTKLQKMILLK